MRRVSIILGLLAVTGLLAGLAKNPIARMMAERHFESATGEERDRRAAELWQHGDDSYLLMVMRDSDEERCGAVVRSALGEVGRAPRLAENYAQFSDAGRTAFLEVIPRLGDEELSFVKDAVRSGLQGKSGAERVHAIRAAMRPELQMKAEVVPLLEDTEAVVRRAAILVVGPISEEAEIVSEEELFRRLHDPDLEVRQICESCLKSRGLLEEQIELARHLANPDPTERLQVVNDLRTARDVVADPGPWLERLSRDSDPAVRIAAARASFEMRLRPSLWLDRLAERDNDKTVRQVSSYYRGLVNQVERTEYQGR